MEVGVPTRGFRCETAVAQKLAFRAVCQCTWRPLAIESVLRRPETYWKKANARAHAPRTPFSTVIFIASDRLSYDSNRGPIPENPVDHRRIRRPRPVVRPGGHLFAAQNAARTYPMAAAPGLETAHNQNTSDRYSHDRLVLFLFCIYFDWTERK